jgi:hypothetical protein
MCGYGSREAQVEEGTKNESRKRRHSGYSPLKQATIGGQWQRLHVVARELSYRVQASIFSILAKWSVARAHKIFAQEQECKAKKQK